MADLKDAQFTAQELRSNKEQQLLDSNSTNDTKDNENKYEKLEQQIFDTYT